MNWKASVTSGERRRAAVIGSGFGGLGAAIRLQSAGVETVLYEARDKPGGRAYVYEDDGFIFDAGPTVITAPHTLEELYELTGRSLRDHVDLLEVSPLYRLIWPDGDRFDYVKNIEDMVSRVAARSPGDVAGYRRFVAYAKEVFDTGYVGLVDQPFLRFRDMISVSPDLIRLRADRSVYKTVAKFVKDEHLRQALSFHSLLVGGNPYSTSAIYTLIHYLEREWGVFFPRGGTHALVRALVHLFEELGGEIRLNCPVESVEVDQEHGLTRHRVKTATDECSYDAVVSNADIHHTYTKLYGSTKSARTVGRRLERKKWSMSLFVLYFGCDRTYDDCAHHTVIFGPRYKGLLKEIFSGHELPDDFSLYLHCPTATDKSMAPKGCSAFYVLSPVPHLGNADVNWDEVADRYGDKIIEALEQELPDLSKHIVTRRHFTPTMFQSELNAFQGSAFSVAPILTQSAWFRPHNKDKHIPGLYLVGAGTHPGAGLPGVLNSAKATVGLVLDDMGIQSSSLVST